MIDSASRIRLWSGSSLISVIEHRTYQVKDQQSRPRTVDCSVPQGSVLGPQKFNAYTEDLAHLIDDHHLDHHMYADDTQLIEYTTASDIPNAIMKLQNCVESIHEWCRSRRLQLNPAKTELIWFGSKASLKKTVHIDLNLYIGTGHHKAGWCCSRSRGLLRQWTEHESACEDRRPQLFFPSLTPQISPAHPRQRSYTRPGVGFRDNQAGLL